MRIVIAISFVFAAGCSQMSNKPKSFEVPTPDGPITANQLPPLEEFPQEIAVVGGEELERFQKLADQAPAFSATYLNDVTNPDLRDFDRAFRAWQLSDSKQHSDQQVIEILGAYLGNKCVSELDMEWVTVKDKFGTDYAVRSKKVESLGFPFSTVMKRVEDRQYEFMHGVFYLLKHRAESGELKKRE